MGRHVAAWQIEPIPGDLKQRAEGQEAPVVGCRDEFKDGGDQRLPDLGLAGGRPPCGDADVAVRPAGGLRRDRHALIIMINLYINL